MLSAELLRQMLDVSQEGILVLEDSGRVVYVNLAFAAWLNLTLNNSDKLTAGTILEKQPAFKKVFKGSRSDYFVGDHKIEKKRLQFDGQPLNVFRLRPLGASTAEMNELIKLNNELNAVYDSSYDGIFVTDGGGKTVSVNQASVEMCGVSAEELVGVNVSELERKKIFYPSITKMVVSERKRLTIIQNTKSGKRVMVTATPIFDTAGKIYRVVCNSRDITELIRLKQELEDKAALVGRYQKEINHFRDRQVRCDDFIVRSQSFRQAVEMAEKVAVLDTTLLLLGESGVGKNLLARHIHRCSERSQGPFVEVNCGIFPENLIESELFGYEKGAFTGAHSGGKVGLVEVADGGTLLLDEISEMPLKLQVKLLHLLQDKTLVRLGSTRIIQVDCRIIAATNNNLEELVDKGLFRKDLYYRLNVVPITIPALRERSEEIQDLIIHFVNNFNRKYGLQKRFSDRAHAEMKLYDWPGNIRELKNIVERIVITTDGAEISAGQVRAHLFPCQQNPSFPMADLCDLKRMLYEFEKEILVRSVDKEANTYKLAKMLGISQSAVVKKLRKFQIRPKNTNRIQ